MSQCGRPAETVRLVGRVGCRSPAGEHRIGQAVDADVAEIARTLAAAFEDYPWTRWLVPADHHADRLAGLFELTIAEIAIRYGEVWAARCRGSDGPVVGAVVAMRPDQPVPPTAWQALESREAALFGDRLTTMRKAERACAVLRPRDPHLTVGTLGITGDHQHRGLGTLLMRRVLHRADHLAVPVYLETSTHANVDFYQRLGFQISGRAAMPLDRPPVWAMVRNPN